MKKFLNSSLRKVSRVFLECLRFEKHHRSRILVTDRSRTQEFPLLGQGEYHRENQVLSIKFGGELLLVS